MSSLEYERLHHNLRLLDLITFESILDNYLEIAVKEEKSTIEILDYLIAQEVQSKEARARNLRMRLAGFPVEKRLEDFDFEFQPSIDRASIKEIASLKFIHNAENLVFLGPPGVGKTHLAIALGIEAAKAGFRVNFANASILVERLARAEKEKKLEDKIRGLSKFQLLIIDEIGYLPFDELGAHCFFQLISRGMKKRRPFSPPINPMANGEISSRITSLRQPSSIGFCTIAQRSTLKEIATGSRIERDRD